MHSTIEFEKFSKVMPFFPKPDASKALVEIIRLVVSFCGGDTGMSLTPSCPHAPLFRGLRI